MNVLEKNRIFRKRINNINNNNKKKLEKTMDDLKISFYDEREINVFENKGIVICRMVGEFGDEEFVGYGAARCNEGDTFDREKGIRIATARAENAVYRKALRDAKYLANYYRGVAELYERFIAKANTTIDHNVNYVERVDRGEIASRGDIKK